MNLSGRITAFAMGGIMLLALPAAAQDVGQQQAASGDCGDHVGIADGAFAGFGKSLPLPPCAEPSLPPGNVTPLFTKKPSEFAEPPGEPIVADTHVQSTELGFEQGVAPAPGRSVLFNGAKYRVVDVVATGGGPTFAGGSPFVIGVSGSTLTVGLKSIVPGGILDPDRLDVSVLN